MLQLEGSMTRDSHDNRELLVWLFQVVGEEDTEAAYRKAFAQDVRDEIH